MTLQAINNVIMQLRSSSNMDHSSSTSDEKPLIRDRTFMPVSYTTADGGLFVGYYLNIHG